MALTPNEIGWEIPNCTKTHIELWTLAVMKSVSYKFNKKGIDSSNYV